MALKFVNKNKTKLKNFLREFSITNTLSSSPFIIKVFDVVFETEDCYVFAQEYAPGGDLFDIIPPQVSGPWLLLLHLNGRQARWLLTEYQDGQLGVPLFPEAISWKLDPIMVLTIWSGNQM